MVQMCVYQHDKLAGVFSLVIMQNNTVVGKGSPKFFLCNR